MSIIKTPISEKRNKHGKKLVLITHSTDYNQDDWSYITKLHYQKKFESLVQFCLNLDSGLYFCEETKAMFKNEEEHDDECECVLGGCADCGISIKKSWDYFVNKKGDNLCRPCGKSCSEDNIIFNCHNCEIPIIRDSEEHDECITKNDEDWFCADCHEFCEGMVENKSLYTVGFLEDFAEDQQNGISISWDYENAEIDKMMTSNELNCRLDLMWVEDIKKRAEWVSGEELYLRTKSNCDGTFYCWYERNKSAQFLWDYIIEKDGYVVKRYFNNYSSNETDEIKYIFYIRPDSIYNDRICDLLNKK